MQAKLTFSPKWGRFELCGGGGQTRTGELIEGAERDAILDVLTRHATPCGETSMELTISDQSPPEVVEALQQMQRPHVSRIVNENLGVHRATGHVVYE